MPSFLFRDPDLVEPVRETAPESRVATKTVIIGALLWIVLVSGTGYVMNRTQRSQEQSREMAAVPPGPASLKAHQVPVYFTNPFDSTEVFEFPPGTAEAQARSTVAALLLERARERLDHEQLTQLTAGVAGHD